LEVYGEVTGFGLMHQARLGRFHQLAVDAYGAQHPGVDGRAIRVAYSLVGLYLALERGWDGVGVRGAHQAMGRPAESWPDFQAPPSRGAVTVLDVAKRGARIGSVEGHVDAMNLWARSVWEAWTQHHPQVADLAARTVPALA
jgi:hypothetical protein